MPLVLAPGPFNPPPAVASPWIAWDGTNDSSNQTIDTSVNLFITCMGLVDTNRAFLGAIDFNQSPARYVVYIIDVTGNSVSAGSPNTISVAGTSATNNCSATVVDTDTIVFCDRTGSTLRAQTATISGTTVTADGSPVTIGGSNATNPTIVPYGNSQLMNGGDYHFAYRQGSSVNSSEVRNVSGTAVGSLKASASNGGASTSQYSVSGGNVGTNFGSSGYSIGGERIAWYSGNGGVPDRLKFSTFDGVSTITEGSVYDPIANIGAVPQNISRALNDDTVMCTYRIGSDMKVRTISLTGLNVTGTNSQNDWINGERWGTASPINTVDSEVVLCAQENSNTADRRVKATVVNWTDVDTAAFGNVVEFDNTGSNGSGVKAVKLDFNRHLVVWWDGTDLIARVMNRV